MNRIVCIMGPTCSGKTALAHKLALATGSEIISADSAAVYRGMDIGTDKPSKSFRADVPYHMVDVADPGSQFTVSHWHAGAEKCIAEIHGRKRGIIVAGGTALYFKRLFGRIVDGPPPDPALRKRLASLETADPGCLHRELAVTDPFLAKRIHENDIKRIVRALEVYELTGIRLSKLQSSGGKPRDHRFLCLSTDMPREMLKSGICSRVENMFKNGLLDEVRILSERFKPDVPPAFSAIGYAQAWRCINGLIDENTAKSQTIKATYSLLRRQLTWIRAEKDPVSVNAMSFDMIIERIQDFFKTGNISGSRDIGISRQGHLHAI